MPDTDPNSSWPAPSGPPAGGQPAHRTGADAVTPAPATSSGRRWATVGGLGAGLIGGVTAGLVFGVPGLTGASDAPSFGGAVPAQTDEQPPTDSGDAEDGDAPADDDRAELQEEHREAAAERIRENLQALVDDGTLDADQADAVAEHLASELPSRPLGGGHGHGPIGREIIEFDGERGERITERLEVRTERMDELADVLGLERDELVDRLLDGESLADVADAQGVETDALVDVLIAERVERIDDAVADGELDPDEAAERKAALEEMAGAHIDGEHPAGPRGRWEPRGTDDEPADDEPADDEPADDGAD